MEGNAAWSELLGAIARKEADIIITETQIRARREYVKYLNDENQSYVDKIAAAEKEKENLTNQRLALKEDVNLIQIHRKQSDWILKKLRLDIQRTQAKIDDQQDAFEKELSEKVANFDRIKEFYRSRLPGYVELKAWIKQKEEMESTLERIQTNNEVLRQRIQDHKQQLIDKQSKFEEERAKQCARIKEKAELVNIRARLRSEVDALVSREFNTEIKPKIDSFAMLQNLEVLSEAQQESTVTVHKYEKPPENVEANVPLPAVKHANNVEIQDKQPKDIINILQNIIVQRPITSSQLFQENVQQPIESCAKHHQDKDERLRENLEINIERQTMPPPDLIFDMEANFEMPPPELPLSRESEIIKTNPSILSSGSNQFDYAQQQAANRAAKALKSPDDNADNFFSLSPMDEVSGGDKYTNTGGLEFLF